MPRKPPVPPLQVNDVVCFSKLFLRSTGHGATSPAWHARGVVVEVDDDKTWPIATIEWADGATSRVAPCNLARVGTLAASEPIDPRTGTRVRGM